MTAQFPERLHYEGRDHDMCTEPLGEYAALGGALPKFQFSCTALWRGYVGRWRIEGDRLYLVGISGVTENGVEANLGMLFPGFPSRVFAHWYTGVLRCPRGKIVEYVHGGYGSTFEADLLIDVRKGVVVGATLRRNVDTCAGESDESETAVGAWVTFPPRRQGAPDGDS